MALRTICVYPNPVLREETEEVTVFDDELKTLVADMWETMYANASSTTRTTNTCS